MSEPLPKPFQEYLKLSEKIDELEEKKVALRKQMLDIFDDYNTNEMFFTEGAFYRKSRTTWNYSDGMKEMEKRVRELKKKEELTGVATIKTSIQFVAFNSRKPDSGTKLK